MKIELRKFRDEEFVIFVCETPEEAKILDVLGDPEDKIDASLHLSDGMYEFYMRARKAQKGAKRGRKPGEPRARIQSGGGPEGPGTPSFPAQAAAGSGTPPRPPSPGADDEVGDRGSFKGKL